MTGIRPKELGSRSPRSFDLDSDSPTVTVEAATSKHRKRVVQPLHPELVVALREWMHCLKPADKLFPKLERRKAWLMVKQDIERGDIPYENHDGFAVFHAAGGHTYITELLSNGATLPEAQKLARHSDIKLTVRYVHIGLGDQDKAVANLPAGAVHLRCISGVADQQSASADVSLITIRKRLFPPAIANGNEKQRAQSTGTEAASNWRPDLVAVTTDFRGHFLSSHRKTLINERRETRMTKTPGNQAKKPCLQGLQTRLFEWSGRELNPRPLHCERSALPTELPPL